MSSDQRIRGGVVSLGEHSANHCVALKALLKLETKQIFSAKFAR
jgi:hypothetical protein